MSGKNEKAVEFLNRLLQMEYRAIFNYHLYANALGERPLREELRKFGGVEVKHAQALAERIVELGGKPVWSFPPAREYDFTSAASMLREHLKAEQDVIDLCQESLGALPDEGLRPLLLRIVRDEMEHAARIGEFLKRIDA